MTCEVIEGDRSRRELCGSDEEVRPCFASLPYGRVFAWMCRSHRAMFRSMGYDVTRVSGSVAVRRTTKRNVRTTAGNERPERIYSGPQPRTAVSNGCTNRCTS